MRRKQVREGWMEGRRKGKEGWKERYERGTGGECLSLILKNYELPWM